jgi:predicted small lipoprotein YifL
MKRPLLAAASLALFLSLTGCGLLDRAKATPENQPAPAGEDGSTSAEPTPSARSKVGSVKDSGDIPDPCTLISEAKVKELTGRDITQRDPDGAEPGTAARFCQWQQPSGQLALFLSRTTQSDYDVQIDDATEVDGLGERAYTLAGHLYVLYGTVQVDVYSRGDSDEENLAKEKDVVNYVLPKV